MKESKRNHPERRSDGKHSGCTPKHTDAAIDFTERMKANASRIESIRQQAAMRHLVEKPEPPTAEIIESGDKLILRFECIFGIMAVPFNGRLEISALADSINKALYDYDQRKTLEEYKNINLRL